MAASTNVDKGHHSDDWRSPVWRWCSWRYFGPVGRQRRAAQSQLTTSQQPQSIPTQTVRRRKDKDAEGQLARSYQILRFQKGWVNRRWFGSSLKDIRGNVGKAPHACVSQGEYQIATGGCCCCSNDERRDAEDSAKRCRSIAGDFGVNLSGCGQDPLIKSLTTGRSNALDVSS